jgi:AraC-like DNA-binding protein
MRRLSAEMTMLGFFRMLRQFRPHAKFKRVCFDYPAPAYSAEYTRLFEAPAHFDQAFTGLVFDRALMDAPSPHRDEDIESTLRALAERRMSGLRRRTPYASRVRRLLMQERAPHRVSMKNVARLLDVSVRSLHRRLADEGQSYVAIANEASGVLAKRLIAEENRTIQETAFLMGFNDVSSFHRAFKRWTGTTPTKFRQNR